MLMSVMSVIGAAADSAGGSGRAVALASVHSVRTGASAPRGVQAEQALALLAPAIAHHEAPLGDRNDIPEGRDTVLERHLRSGEDRGRQGEDQAVFHGTIRQRKKRSAGGSEHLHLQATT